MFKDFERLDTEATSKAEGAGLGLALSSRLATLMGGSLGHSDNPVGGSIFWLELRLDAAAIPISDALPAPETADLSAKPASPLQVLVVDDVFMNREIASSILIAKGHVVTCMKSGLEAVAAAASNDFDVILMDVRMPEMDGFEATRQIRALAGRRGQTPIVALTAQAFSDQIAACRQAGMDGHLAKPFDPDSLLATVLHAANQKPRESIPVPAASALLREAPPPDPPIHPDLPVFTRAAFDRTAVHLTPDAVSSYLRTVAELGQTVLDGLRPRDGPTSAYAALTDTVHKLAGAAGMFGFERAASVSRRFEHAVDSGAVDAPALVTPLYLAIEAMHEEIRTRTLYLSNGAHLSARAPIGPAEP